MADIQLLLEAERRGLLPPDKQALLDEARRRGLIQGVSPAESAAPEPERTIGGYAKEAVKGLVPGLVGLGETAITGAAALLPEEAEQAVRKPVEEFAAGVRERFAPAPGYEDTAVRKVSEAVGSTIPFLPLGALGLAGRAAAVGLGVSAGAGEARQRAEQEAATESERAAATALGIAPGALEALPPIRILRRFGFGDEAIKEVAGVAPALSRIARAGGEEALQEASSQVLQNLIAKGVYKPEEAVFGGVGEAAALGGGAGAVVSAIAELALGRRLRGPEAEPTAEEAAVTEEEELPTAEALAPKEGRVARAAPIRAKTREELAGLIPAAPKAEEPEVAAPREPMVFERTKEPTPEAVQEAAEFVAKFPEGSKGFDMFKARSIAKKLGYEGIPQKGVGRADLEPLIRGAVVSIPESEAVEEVAPSAEVPREQAAGVGEVVTGAGAGGVELPVSRPEPEGREAAALAGEGLEGVSVPADRAVERKGEGAAALESVETAPSARPQVFESVQPEVPPADLGAREQEFERLNVGMPAFVELYGGDRAPSLRRDLGKAVKDFNTGKLSGEQLGNYAAQLYERTKPEVVDSELVRGPEQVRERLFNASRNGYLNKDGVELAAWFIQQNPALARNLAISIPKRPEDQKGVAGFYNPNNRMVTLFKQQGDTQTAVHEILHHTERMMPDKIRAGILKAYTKQLTKAIKTAKSDEERLALDTLLNFHFDPTSSSGYDTVIDQIKKGKLPKDIYQFVNPSEFWAVNGARIVQGRYDVPPGVIAQIKKWLREFIQKAKSVFGLKSDAAIIRALDSLAKADGRFQTDMMLRGEMIDEAAVFPAIEPIAEKAKKSVLEVTREASEKMVKPGVVKQTISKMVGPETTFEKIATNFQNVNRKIKKIQNDLKAANRLVVVGADKNNVDDQISAAANRASYIVATEVEPVVKRLRESITDYARTTKATIKDALDKASSYRIALHELERRETKYLRNVPLNNTTKEEFLPGEPAMTAADARAELEKRRSLAANKEQAEAIQDMMRYLAANYADPRGFSPVKAKLEQAGKPTPEEMTTDFYDDIYNVIGPEYTREALDEARQEYENLDPENKALVDRVFSDLDALHELNKNLNRRANYWTDKVDRVVESYGWKNYVPFKGSPKSDKTFDTDTEYLSGELSQAPESFEGRRTGFDNPILQTISESYFAASRAGRGTDVTQTIKNLIKLGVIKSKKMKKFSFEDRNSPDFDYDQVRGRDKVLHYNDDGSVEVYSIKNPEVLEAIKTPFREMNWATKMGNAITSTLGQLHTRYNPAFPPMDFIRNSLTNAGLISAREGGKQAREYLTAVAANVARNGLWKSGKLSKLLTENRADELKRLATIDSFYRDALEMVQYGGRTMYRMSFNVSDTMEELQKQLGPKKILKDESSFFKYIDAYNDAFELTSRVGAYSIRKQQNIAAAKDQGLDVNDPKVIEDINKEAAAFSLSLMDFRKIGRYGRELGAWFMFIRPAATGAVDAIDALRPGFMTPQKAFARLEPEVQELFETQGLAEEIKRIQGNKRPDKKKIAELEQEIVNRQQAFDKFEASQLTRAKNARNTAMFTIAAGAALYGMAAAISGEDDEGRNRVATDDMSRWTRYLRLPIIGDEGFFQIPWGFGVSGLMSAGAQTAALASGASSFKDFAGNMVEIGIDSFLPIPASRINPFENFGAWIIDSATPSAARPLVEFVLNVDAMGNPIYNSRAGKYADAFSGSTRPSEIHRAITQQIFNITNGTVDISPDTVAFFLNNYADAPNHIAENSWNLVLTAIGDKQFDAKKDTFVLRSFIGRNSNYDARKFAEAESKIKDLARRRKTIEDFGTPEQLERFYANHPNADILIDTYNAGVNGELRKLQQERNQYKRDPSLTPKDRKMLLDDLQISENYIKKGLVEDFAAYEGP